MIGGGDSLPLSRRGLIGDTATAALVAADGTVDWWCPERFDAAPALWRLLDTDGPGVQVGPAVPVVGTQSYVERTNVLRTSFVAGEGALDVVDFMPWVRGRGDGRQIVRVVECTRGSVDVRIAVGAERARDVAAWSEGIVVDGLTVRTGVDMNGRTGVRRLEAGERFVVTIGEGDALSTEAAMELRGRVEQDWRLALFPLTYVGTHRSTVERSLLALKALTYEATGAVVAAPTTSLPEAPGGERNWDYRFAWVRDASLATAAIRDAGLVDDAANFADWVAAIARLDDLPLRPMYRIDGTDVPDEEDWDGIDGFLGSQPVRLGNAARGQVQLDFYGDLFSLAGDLPDAWDALARMADWLADNWGRPDDKGIWEVRSEPGAVPSSRLAAWFALDTIARRAQGRNPLDLQAVGWRQAARDIAAWAEDAPLEPLDASMLRIAWRGPWPARHPKVIDVVDRILERLGNGPHLYRYDPSFDDGLPPGEGAFVACGFWAVCALAAQERWGEAHSRMDALCGWANRAGHVGLLPEEVDPISGAFLGNLPQALSHLSLIQAALALEEGPR